jgi:hypothetical protein
MSKSPAVALEPGQFVLDAEIDGEGARRHQEPRPISVPIFS